MLSKGLKISYLELWQPFCSASGTICAIMLEGIMKNNSVKLIGIWASGSGDVI